MSATAASRSQFMRQSLHLSIDPSPYHPNPVQLSPDSPYTSSSSARPSSDTAGTSPSSSGSETIIYSVLCMYDFASDDPVHLPFTKNEILDVVKQEGTGWWAAMRRGGDTIGWIPQAFVKPLTEEMTERLWNVREELRVYEYEAEQLYVSAPISRIPYEEPELALSSLVNNSRGSRAEHSLQKSRKNDDSSPDPRRRPYPPPSPATPMPQPPPSSVAGPRFTTNKPTPPTPTEQDTSISPQDRGTPASITRRRLPQLTTLSEDSAGKDASVSPDALKRRDEKIKQLTGSDEALAFHVSVLSQANLKWYLKPTHGEEIQLDAEGKLISGTRIALVEKLVWDTTPPPRDSHKLAQDTAWRRMFLTTFRTFMSANDLFDMMVEIYRMSYPENLTDSEFNEWRDRCLQPTQRMVLTVFTMWLEDHRLLEEEPHIAGRLTEFLALVKPPSPLALTAQLIVQSITRLTFATNPTTVSPVTNRRRRKAPKNDLLLLQPSDIAEQLSLLEFRLYSKITPQEVIANTTQSSKTQTGCSKSASNLTAFCATHDKLAAWVTDTILSNQALSRRSDTVDFWIKVAEKCKNMNNFASMSAIINALSSTVIARLHLTWAHVGRKNMLEALLKYNEPTRGFSGYRQLHLHAEGSCVPFIGMYLTELVHIKDQYSDEDDRVSVVQRQRWYEVVLIMLRSQSKPYNIAENDTMNYISNHMRGLTPAKDWQAKFWSKSQEVQHSELAHADIRRGLEAAGF